MDKSQKETEFQSPHKGAAKEAEIRIQGGGLKTLKSVYHVRLEGGHRKIPMIKKKKHQRLY